MFIRLLRELILEHKRDPHLPINPLSLRLNGIVDAAVMGGINNYEKVRFSSFISLMKMQLNSINRIQLLKYPDYTCKTVYIPCFVFQAFFTTEYMEHNPDKVGQIAQLKELIAAQIPLLEVGIRIHGDVAPPALGPFQQRLEQCFAQMQSHVVANYGAKVMLHLLKRTKALSLWLFIYQ